MGQGLNGRGLGEGGQRGEGRGRGLKRDGAGVEWERVGGGGSERGGAGA